MFFPSIYADDFFVFRCNCSRRKFGFYLSKVTVETGNLRPHINIAADSPPSPTQTGCTQIHYQMSGVEWRPNHAHATSQLKSFAPIILPKSSCAKTMRRLYPRGVHIIISMPTQRKSEVRGCRMELTEK